VKKRKVETVLMLQAPRCGELRFGIVDADDARAPPGEPGGDICGPAAELDCILPREISRQHPDVRLGNPPYSPRRGIPCPVGFTRQDVISRPTVPQCAIAKDVLGKFVHPRTRVI
jgi:hypothetical protein